MFVDNSLFAQTRDQMKHAMVASIEALHIILGYPETDIRQNPLSLDKHYESTCSIEHIQLDITINTRRMTLALTEKKDYLCSMNSHIGTRNVEASLSFKVPSYVEALNSGSTSHHGLDFFILI